jgi:hypothetical protein
MQGRYLLLAAAILIASALVIWHFSLSGWWMILGLWIACIPALLGLVAADGSSDRSNPDRR